MKAYELNWDYDHLVDMYEDCSVIPFEGIEEFRFQMGGVEKCLVKHEILLRGNLNVISQNTDFPIVEIGVPLMSKKLIELLEKESKVNLNKIQATILDDTYLDHPCDEKGNLLSAVKKNQNYQFVQVLEYSKIFDYNNSVFKPLRSNPKKVGIISKLILKEPVQGFPGIFRIEEKPSILFVSHAIKILMESNGIKGCVFNKVP